jgi:hypothetical protein
MKLHYVRYAVTLPELAILFSADHELIIRWGGSTRCKNCECGNGASVCLWSVAFFEVVTESDFRHEKKLKNWPEIHPLHPLIWKHSKKNSFI